MFSTAQIISRTNAKSFDRGSAIASAEGQVGERRFLVDGAGCEVSAKVRSASAVTERFSTYVFLDADCEEIESYECNCPASRKHSVMCKHCVACALSFKRDPDSFAGYSKRNVRVTTRALKRFMDGSDRLDSTSRRIEGISIAAHLTNDFGAWSARFKLGNGRDAYVMSDISEFARAIDKGTYLSYGKRLGFVHALDSFDEPSKRIAEFIALSAASKEARRSLPLSDLDAIRLLDAIGDASFDYSSTSLRADLRGIAMQGPAPRMAISIEEEDGGYRIGYEHDMELLSAGGRAYAFDSSGAYRLTGDSIRAAAFVRDVLDESDGDAFIAAEDLPEFCVNILPRLEEGADVIEPEALSSMKPINPSFQFYFDREGRGEGSHVSLSARVLYGEREYDLISASNLTQGVGVHARDPLAASQEPTGRRRADAANMSPLAFGATEDGCYRDEDAEQEAIELIERYMPNGLTLPLSHDQEMGALLFEGLSNFQEAGTVFTTPAFDRLLRDAPIRVSIGISLDGDLIDLDIHSSDVSKEELARILSTYKQRKRYHRLKDGSIASMEALELHEFERLATDLGLTLDDIRRGSAQVPLYNAFLLDREYSDLSRDEGFADYIERFDDDSLFDFEVPQGLEATMRPYQVEGYQWFRKLASIGFGGILADEMGLGKSLQAIAYIVSILGEDDQSSSDPTLIVCPASLVYNWVEEFAKFAPEVTVDPIDGPRAERRRKLTSSDADVLIASYDTVRIDLERFEEMSFSSIFLDETQYIKNHGTKTTRAIKRLKGRNRFALTGTPIENRLSELWSIFDFLMPGFLGTYAAFRTRFEADIIGGDEDAAAHLSALVGPFILRRLKEDVLGELPAKQEIVHYVNLTEGQRRLYDASEQSLRDDLLAQRRSRLANTDVAASQASTQHIDMLAELLRLRQISLDPSLAYEGYGERSAKTESTMGLIEQAVASGRKSLVFSQFTSYLDILKEELLSRGIPFYEITGATDKRERLRLVNSFNEDDVPVFLISLKAGGTGLNLTGASVVIHTDPWWNIAAMNQATDRAHRIGQRSNISVYRLIAKGTIEERILRLQEAKSELADSIIGDNSLASLRSLTRRELEELLLD